MDLISQTARTNWRAIRAINDVVYTRPDLTKALVEHFKPSGFCLDPCRGNGAFHDMLPNPKDWCEIAEGRDFLKWNRHIDWCMSNPPWSKKPYRAIARHAFEISDNVVFLTRLHNAIGTYARHKDFTEVGHALKEVVVVDWADAGMSSEGFVLAAFHWRYQWTGGTA